MKKYIMFILFLVGFIISLIIVYRNIDNPFSNKFVIGFVIYLLLYGLYLTTVCIVNIRKMNKGEIRKRTWRFITLFILFSLMNYMFHYLFQPSKNDNYGFLFIALGYSLGLSFLDLTFYKKKHLGKLGS
ncbi:hypothetical protein [Psychrobacillus vulpis]|uniref:Uncharacterized protein n=1 Tax=Psychrobacillus vulpis TaxID=2325572 RepID=A0A544TTQ7_9BACI|nr:hypothetical protein [Psychrobacillus vulpis]TQR20857.1 hypothetical protein FG384_04485 [Psychrobacillus vulpis]